MNRLELVLGHEDAIRPAVGRVGSDLLARRSPTATPRASGTSGPASSTRRSPSTGASTTTSSHILRRDWEKGLGKKLEGKLHIYVGDMDNYYLNNAVYLVEEFLESTKNPYYDGEVDYGDRAEHCWNGDPHAPERAVAPALSPDVHSEGRGADAEDGAGGRRPQELALLNPALATPPMLTVRCFGSFQVTHAGRALEFPTRRSRALLAYLAASGDHWQTRESLAALLWPESGAEAARRSLRQELSTVRALVGDAALEVEADRVRLAPGQYLVRPRTRGIGTAHWRFPGGHVGARGSVRRLADGSPARVPRGRTRDA